MVWCALFGQLGWYFGVAKFQPKPQGTINPTAPPYLETETRRVHSMAPERSFSVSLTRMAAGKLPAAHSTAADSTADTGARREGAMRGMCGRRLRAVGARRCPAPRPRVP